MKKTDFLKIAAVAVISTGLMAGCASDTTEEPAPATEVAKDCPNAAAKNAPPRSSWPVPRSWVTHGVILRR